MLTLKSVKSIHINKKILKQIILLKQSHYKYNFISQLEYFKKNYKKDDLHNLLFLNDKLIGYTGLRKIRIKLNSKSKKILLFDTLLLNKKLRKKSLSSILMSFNNFIIKKNKIPSFLKCNKELVNFYKKFGWKKTSKKLTILAKDKKEKMYFNLH
jgi:predicted GNAT family N-acyltransferase